MRKEEQLTKSKTADQELDGCSKNRTADLEQNIRLKRKIADTETARRLYVGPNLFAPYLKVQMQRGWDMGFMGRRGRKHQRDGRKTRYMTRIRFREDFETDANRGSRRTF